MPTETALPPTSRKITICDPVESPAGSLPYRPYFHLATLRKTTHFPIQAPVGIRLRMCLILNGIKFLNAGKKQFSLFEFRATAFAGIQSRNRRTSTGRSRKKEGSRPKSAPLFPIHYELYSGL